MIGKKIIESKSIPLVQVEDLLKNRKKTEEELNFEQQMTLKYARKFSKVTSAKSDKLFEELSNVQGLTDEFKIKLIDVLPQDIETLKLMISKTRELPDEKLNEILTMLKKFA